MRPLPGSRGAGPDAPPSREVLGVCLLFASIVGLLIALTAGALYVLGGVRAYVGGEAHYSKSQKHAVKHLLLYATTRDERHYAAFESGIRVPLADGRARRELSKPDADLAAGARALVEGGNHPDDVMTMARLFRWAGWVPEMRAAIEIWARGDERVERLAALGATLHAELSGAAPGAARLRAILGEVESLDHELTELEDRFSETLAAGARRIRRQALLAVAGSGVALTALGIATSAWLLGRLRRSEARFRALVEQSQDAIHVVGRDGRILYHSARLPQMLGYATLEGKDTLSLLHPDDAGPARAALERVFAGERLAGPGILRARHADGSWRTHEVVAARLGDFGREAAAVVNSRDVTERRALERRLAEGQRIESLGRLAGGVAHDFNNLLTVILGSASEALDASTLESETRHRLEEIVGAGDRAAALTRKLLSFARRQIVAPHDFDLAAQLAAAEPLLRRLAGPGVRFSLALEAAAAPVRADPGQIEQVVLNLVTNARDAMPEGGELEVALDRIRVEPGAASPETGGLAGELVRVRVRDTGVAMDEHVQARIFEPFFTTKSADRGSGLGLSVCHGIVEQCGGHIGFDSRPGVGTTFRVLLPATEAPAERPANEAAPVGRETVLLAEDDDGVRRVVAGALRRSGYRVIEARGADEALAAARAAPGGVDLLVTDVEMPGGGGRGLAAQLRSEQPGLAVLFVSGHTEDTALRREVERAELPFLAKPFGPADLARKVREVLDART